MARLPKASACIDVKVDVHLLTKTTCILQKIDYFKEKSID